MRWEDERYVRVYTRDTPDWMVWPWQSRALLPLLMRKLDRQGVIELGKHGVTALAAAVALPVEVVEAGLAGLLTDGCVIRNGSRLVMRNFIRGQEAVASAKLRQKTWRDREKIRDASLLDHNVASTNVDAERRGETARDAARRGETPSLAVPSLAVPDLKALSNSKASSTVVEVFEFWRETMKSPRSKLDGAREKPIKQMLAKGYTADELKLAVQGCALDPFSMGDNDRGQKYNQLRVICRDSDHVEKFMAIAVEHHQQPRPESQRRKTDEEIEREFNEQWEREHGTGT